jgi:hypothetical protein
MSTTEILHTSKAVKKIWDSPRVEIVELNAAEGSQPGPKCDKHGSLSTGPGCTP